MIDRDNRRPSFKLNRRALPPPDQNPRQPILPRLDHPRSPG